MAHNSSHDDTSLLPAQLVEERRAGWKDFTRATVYACVGVAVAVIVTVLFAKFY